MATPNLDGMRLNLYSSTDGLVAQSDLGQNKVVLKGIPAGTKVNTGDYKVGFEDITGTVSPLADVPAFTSSGSAASASPASLSASSSASSTNAGSGSASGAPSSASSAGSGAGK